MQRKVTKLRIHIRDIIVTDLPSYIFHQMAPPSGSVVPFVLVMIDMSQNLALEQEVL